MASCLTIAALATRTVLIYDRDLAAVAEISSLLRERGYTILLASDPEDALQQYRQHGPSMLLLDEDTGANEILIALREVDDLTAAIVMSRTLEQQSAFQLYHDGADMVVQKEPYGELCKDLFGLRE
jgi:CheY-like chemotaxis protein